MKNSFPFRKLCLTLTAIGVLGFAPVAAAECVKPKVSGYEFVSCLQEGLAEVEQNGKYGFIDKTGKVVIPIQYDGIGNFSEGLARVKQNGKWGYLNESGKVMIPLQYDDANDFKNGRTAVRLNGEKFYIDKKGRRIADAPK